jgi:hypothetical protein
MSGCGSSPAAVPVLERGPAVAKVEISSDYNALFDFTDQDTTRTLDDVADAGPLRASIVSELGHGTGFRFDGVRILLVDILGVSGCRSAALSSPCARVTYDVVNAQHDVVVPGAVGYATVEDNRWVVARTTTCSLLTQLATAEHLSPDVAGC